MTTEMIISGVIGLIAGIIGSLIAPWVHWGIEKRKIRHQKRIEMINEVREYVQKPNYDRINFRETGVYSQIKPFLDSNIIKRIEIPSNEICVDVGNLRGAGIQNYKNEILDNLTKLEKGWKLI
jgi:hypothetical protein